MVYMVYGTKIIKLQEVPGVSLSVRKISFPNLHFMLGCGKFPPKICSLICRTFLLFCAELFVSVTKPFLSVTKLRVRFGKGLAMESNGLVNETKSLVQERRKVRQFREQIFGGNLLQLKIKCRIGKQYFPDSQ